MIKYLGSKRLLVEAIVAAVRGFSEDVASALDLFSGTARVGIGLKEAGLRVTSNDHLAYAATLARCYVGSDARRWQGSARSLVEELQSIPPNPGYFTRTFCEEARYLQPHNGARVDAIREAIAQRALPPQLEAIALTSLMEAADRVDSTTGVQMAYLKKWAKRSYNPLSLRVPRLTEGEGEVLQMDAEEAADADVDVAYLDPPYNQHSYMGNYHVWETLVRWDAPESYGVARKRIGCREYRSPFNRKREIATAMEQVLARLRARHLVVSFNNEGYLGRADLERLLRDYGYVRTLSTDFKRYVGAQIGIYNPSGKKVGRVSHLRNRELLFLVSKSKRALARCAQSVLKQRLLDDETKTFSALGRGR